jgi:hypothetical protein
MDWLFAYFNSAPIIYTFYSILEFHSYFHGSSPIIGVLMGVIRTTMESGSKLNSSTSDAINNSQYLQSHFNLRQVGLWANFLLRNYERITGAFTNSKPNTPPMSPDIFFRNHILMAWGCCFLNLLSPIPVTHWSPFLIELCHKRSESHLFLWMRHWWAKGS